MIYSDELKEALIKCENAEAAGDVEYVTYWHEKTVEMFDKELAEQGLTDLDETIWDQFYHDCCL